MEIMNIGTRKFNLINPETLNTFLFPVPCSLFPVPFYLSTPKYPSPLSLSSKILLGYKPSS